MNALSLNLSQRRGASSSCVSPQIHNFGSALLWSSDMCPVMVPHKGTERPGELSQEVLLVNNWSVL